MRLIKLLATVGCLLLEGTAFSFGITWWVWHDHRLRFLRGGSLYVLLVLLGLLTLAFCAVQVYDYLRGE